MSSQFSIIGLWNVVSNTITNLVSPNDGDKIQNIVLPKSSEAAVTRMITVTSVDGNNVELGYLDRTLLKGDKGDTGNQGVQGIQGIQGVPGVNGANGLGLDYVATTEPGAATEGQTWLEKQSWFGGTIHRLWQRRASRWVDVEIHRNTFIQQGLSANTTISLYGASNYGASSEGAVLRSCSVYSRQGGGANGTDYWRLILESVTVNSSGASVATSIATVNMNLAGLGGVTYNILAGRSSEFVIPDKGWLQIRLEKVGVPAALRIHGEVGVSFVR